MPKTYWYYQIWISSEKYGALSAVYHYSGCDLSDAVDRAMMQYWDDHDYSGEPQWNDPNIIDFTPSLVQRSQSEFQTIYTENTLSTLEHAINEAS